MNPARVEAFALAYVPAVLVAVQAAVKDGKLHLGASTPEEYAVSVAVESVRAVQRAGLQAIEHYYFNTHGGALRRTCQALGIPETTRALEDYLGGTP